MIYSWTKHSIARCTAHAVSYKIKNSDRKTINTSHPRSVLILHDLSSQLSGRSNSTLHFLKLVKKIIGGIAFRFVPLDSPMFVVSVTLLASCKPCNGICWTHAQQAVLTFDTMHAFVDIAADPCHQTQ